MSSFNEPIRYCLDTTLLDFSVSNHDQTNGRDPQAVSRPWFTFCLEPITRMVPAFLLSVDPPGPAAMKSLLFRMLVPSDTFPSGKRPDELLVNSPFLFAQLYHQGLLQHLHIGIGRIPPSWKALPERAIHQLSLALHHRFPTSLAPGNSRRCEQQESILLAQLEEVCGQWAVMFSTRGEVQHRFLASCQARWQACPVDPRELALFTEESSA